MRFGAHLIIIIIILHVKHLCMEYSDWIESSLCYKRIGCSTYCAV